MHHEGNLTIHFDQKGFIVLAHSYDTCILATTNRGQRVMNITRLSPTTTRHRKIVEVNLKHKEQNWVEVSGLLKAATYLDVLAEAESKGIE